MLRTRLTERLLTDMSEGYLTHHGIKGQRWGIRRYQNPDGTLTKEGKERYGINENGWMSKEGKKLFKKDRDEGYSRFSRSVSNLPYKEQVKALNNYLKETNTNSKALRNYNKQILIERDFKDLQLALKQMKDSGYEHVMEIAVNNKGYMHLRTEDPQYRKYNLQGYEACKSIEDVMKLVNISDLK